MRAVGRRVRVRVDSAHSESDYSQVVNGWAGNSGRPTSGADRLLTCRLISMCDVRVVERRHEESSMRLDIPRYGRHNDLDMAPADRHQIEVALSLDHMKVLSPACTAPVLYRR